MSIAALPDSLRKEVAATLRAERAVKDKSYRRFWLGQEVGAFLRAKRLERCAKNTLDSYETTLRLFTLDHCDAESFDIFTGPEGADLVVDFLTEHWGESAPATLDNRTGALRSFFAWTEETGRIARAPRIKRKRVGGQKIREAHELAEIRLVVAAQTEIADEVALLLMGRLGFRKDDVRRFQVRDVDLAHDRVFIRKGKGDKPVELPIAFDELRDALTLWLAEASGPHEYLWFPVGHRTSAPNPSTVHRRFKRCLERAGATDFPMHELRHSAIDRAWRESGDFVLANMVARHSSYETTRRYVHPTLDDMRERLRATDEERS